MRELQLLLLLLLLLLLSSLLLLLLSCVTETNEYFTLLALDAQAQHDLHNTRGRERERETEALPKQYIMLLSLPAQNTRTASRGSSSPNKNWHKMATTTVNCSALQKNVVNCLSKKKQQAASLLCTFTKEIKINKRKKY